MNFLVKFEVIGNFLFCLVGVADFVDRRVLSLEGFVDGEKVHHFIRLVAGQLVYGFVAAVSRVAERHRDNFFVQIILV